MPLLPPTREECAGVNGEICISFLYPIVSTGGGELDPRVVPRVSSTILFSVSILFSGEDAGKMHALVISGIDEEACCT